MIKAGIYGPSQLDSPIRKQLLRLLLRHPDIDLRTVAAKGAPAIPLCELHPVYTGETDLRLEAEPNLDDLDVLFVIDSENISDNIRNLAADNDEFRLIVLGKADDLRANLPEGMVYGFAECNRKALVRGARMAVSPSPEALLLETALFPLAKNWMLPAGADIEVCIGGEFSGSDFLAEAKGALAAVQTDLNCTFTLRHAPAPHFGRMDMSVRIPCTQDMADILTAYSEAYADHSFVYIVPAHVDPGTEDLRGSNKCLLALSRTDGGIMVRAWADGLTRGCVGNAVHLMNLLFGLLERTGLNI